MSRWNEEFEQLHFVRQWSRVKEVLQRIDKSLLSNKQVALEYARIRKVEAFIEQVLNGIDPEMCNFRILDESAGHLEDVISNIDYFSQTTDLGTLQNANNQLSEILIAIGQLLFTPSDNEKRSLTSAAEAYSEAINEHIEQNGQLFVKLKRDFLELQANISEEQEVRKSTQNEFNTKFNEATGKLDDFVRGFEKQFAATEGSRSERFKQELEQYSDAAKENLDLMSSKKEDAEKILGVIIEATHAGSYKNQANEDKRSADVLRNLSIFLMVVASILLAVPIIASLLWAGLFEFSWKEIINRTAVSSAFFITAIYCARESTKHRLNEQKNRKRELTLVSARPFLALLDDSKEKEEMKLKIANNLFIDETAIDERSEVEGD